MSLIQSASLSAPVLVIGTACLIYLLYRRLIFKPIPGIPYNKDTAYTLMGDTLQAAKVLKEDGCMFPWLISQATRNNAPVYQVFMRLGKKPWVIVADFKEAHDAMLRRTSEFDRSELVADVFTGVAPDLHINMKTGDLFRAHRKLINDLMTPGFLNKVAAPHVYKAATNLAKYWTLKAQLAQDHMFDASEDIFNYTLDSITGVAFGLDSNQNCLSNMTQHLQDSPQCKRPQSDVEAAVFDLPARPPLYGALVHMMETLGGTIKSPVPRFYHWCIRQTPSYRNACAIKENMIKEEIDKSIQRYQSGDRTETCGLDNVLQAELKAAKKADRAPDVRSRVIADELLGFLFGGHDTSASTMCWGFKHLAANPSIQTKLRTHLREAFPQALAEGRNPTYNEITGSTIPYLDATLEEIHRKAKVFPFVFRTAVVDTTILGYHIPAGTDVMFCQSGPSYDTAPFDIPDSQRSDTFRSAKYNIGEWDPEDMQAFRPERWIKLDQNGHEVFDPAAGPIMAFALGVRGCYGRRLAYMQMRMLAVSVIWNLELLPVKGELSSFQPLEKLATVPRYTYLRLKVLEK